MKQSIYIEKLDKGCILNVDGRTEAVEDITDITSKALDELRRQLNISMANKANRSLYVEIDFKITTNPPKAG